VLQGEIEVTRRVGLSCATSGVDDSHHGHCTWKRPQQEQGFDGMKKAPLVTSDLQLQTFQKPAHERGRNSRYESNYTTVKIASVSANTYTAAQGTNEAEEFCIVDWLIVLVRNIRSSSA
jgi:hypothetical protein